VYSTRSRPTAPALAIIASAGGLFAPLLLLLWRRQVLTFDDLAAIHLPLRYVYASALRAGDSILWSSAFYSGLYLHGEGEAGMVHPLHLALYRFLPLDVAFNLELMATYAAALLGMRLCLARFPLSRESTWVGAMVFAFSGFNLLHLMHVNGMAVVAHIPWLLWTTHVALTSPSPRARTWAFVGFAAGLGSALLLGHPQYVWIALVAVGTLAAGLTITGAAWRRLQLLVLAVVCGVCVGAVQWLPTLDALGSSVRSSPSETFRLSFSLSPVNLLQLWSPHAFAQRAYTRPDEAAVHEFSVYNGAFCSLALVWIAVRWRALRRRALASSCLVMAGFSLVLALGRYGGVYPLLAVLPGVSAFRAPARFLVLFHLSLSALAAIAFDDLLAVLRSGERLATGRLWLLAIPAGLSAATTLGAVVFAGSSWASAHGVSFSSLTAAAPWSLVMIAVALLMVAAGRGARWAPSLLVMVTALDLGVWGYGYIYAGGRVQAITDLVNAAPAPPAARAGDLYEPTATGNGPPENLGVLRGLRLSTGYMGLRPSSVLTGDLVAMRIAGVAWRHDGTAWVPIPDPMPRVRLLADIRRADDSESVRAMVSGIDMGRVAVVSGAVRDVAGTPGAVRIVSDRPGRLLVESHATAAQMLVTTERFHAGWQAFQDGRPVPASRVYGDFLGCRVDAGDHRVELTFEPASLRNGLRLTLAGLALTAVSAAVLWSRATG
jgi:hypothetical protein